MGTTGADIGAGGQGEGYEGGETAGEGGGADEAEAHQEDDDLYADIVPGLAQVDGVRACAGCSLYTLCRL